MKMLKKLLFVAGVGLATLANANVADIYQDYGYGTVDNEYRADFFQYSGKEYFDNKEAFWQEEIDLNSEEVKNALETTEQLNKETQREITKEEIEALKVETQLLRQQMLNYLIYHRNNVVTDKLYQDKFRHLYNRSKDIVILLIDNKVRDKEMLEMTLDYRVKLEKLFLNENKTSQEFFLQQKAKKLGVTKSVSFLKRLNPEELKIVREIKTTDAYKKFDRIAEHYKETNQLLRNYINVEIN